MRYIIGMVAAFSCVATAPAHAARAPMVLEPASPWKVRYDEDSCRASRMFGEGKDETAFYIERYQPSSSMFTVVAGRPLIWADDRDEMTISLAPAGVEQKIKYSHGNLGRLSPAIMTTLTRGSSVGQSIDGLAQSPSPDSNEALDKAQFANVNSMTLHMRGGHDVVLALGDMTDVMTKMRACTSQLLSGWGIDAEKHKHLTRTASPSNSPADWITSADYPAMAVREGKIGLVQFRLNIDERGQPTSCHIQKTTQPDQFDDAVCNALMKNARFTPALDAQRQPIASYYLSSVSFEIGR